MVDALTIFPSLFFSVALFFFKVVEGWRRSCPLLYLMSTVVAKYPALGGATGDVAYCLCKAYGTFRVANSACDFSPGPSLWEWQLLWAPFQVALGYRSTFHKWSFRHFVSSKGDYLQWNIQECIKPLFRVTRLNTCLDCYPSQTEGFLVYSLCT